MCEKDKVIPDATRFSAEARCARGVYSGACALRSSRRRASHRSGCRFFPLRRQIEEGQQEKRSARRDGRKAPEQGSRGRVNCEPSGKGNDGHIDLVFPGCRCSSAPRVHHLLLFAEKTLLGSCLNGIIIRERSVVI